MYENIMVAIGCFMMISFAGIMLYAVIDPNFEKKPKLQQ